MIKKLFKKLSKKKQKGLQHYRLQPRILERRNHQEPRPLHFKLDCMVSLTPKLLWYNLILTLSITMVFQFNFQYVREILKEPRCNGAMDLMLVSQVSLSFEYFEKFN